MNETKFCKECKEETGEFIKLKKIAENKLKCPKCGRIITLKQSVILLEKVREEILEQIDSKIIEYIKYQLSNIGSDLYKLFQALVDPESPPLNIIIESSKIWNKLRGKEIPQKLIKSTKEVIIKQRKDFIKETLEDPNLELLSKELKSLLKIPEKVIKEALQKAIEKNKSDPLVKNIGISLDLLPKE